MTMQAIEQKHGQNIAMTGMTIWIALNFQITQKHKTGHMEDSVKESVEDGPQTNLLGVKAGATEPGLI